MPREGTGASLSARRRSARGTGGRVVRVVRSRNHYPAPSGPGARTGLGHTAQGGVCGRRPDSAYGGSDRSVPVAQAWVGDRRAASFARRVDRHPAACQSFRRSRAGVFRGRDDGGAHCRPREDLVAQGDLAHVRDALSRDNEAASRGRARAGRRRDHRRIRAAIEGSRPHHGTG
jgi:hypothetical protein